MRTAEAARLTALTAAGSLALFVAACSSSGSSGQAGVAARAVPPAEGPVCVVRLSYASAAFDRLADSANGDGCGVRTAVALMEMPTPLSRPVTVDCGLALRLAAWDRDVLQPLARDLFGQGLKVIHHYGGYVCRGRSSDRSRLSEHAFGRAIDVGAFELEDGTIISVRRHWSASDARGTFLRRAAQAACARFSVVLTPDADRHHRDHFHLDVGPWKLCRA